MANLSPGVSLLLEDLRNIQQENDTADLLFVIGESEEKFYAHKLIIWARCRTYRKFGKELWGNTSRGQLVTLKQQRFHPRTFKKVMDYIYGGTVVLTDDVVFECWALALELGLPDLQDRCEEHVNSILCIDNACALLTSAHKLTELPGHEKLDLVDKCGKYVLENAEDCSRTDGWNNLGKESLVWLLKSDKLCLDESDVWRSVMRWACHQQSLSIDCHFWSSTERDSLFRLLEDVMPHVRLLLIDSEVFAGEVEPTRLLPMEVMMERYKLAAFPHGSPGDPRLRSRVNLKLFHGTEILKRENRSFQRHLAIWYGSLHQEWSLVFRASRDGFTANAFHSFCDDLGPTFVIILGANGCICGGYTDISWTNKAPSQGKYLGSKGCFLFSLVNLDNVEPTMFPVARQQFATCHHAAFGPVFGAGADLLLADNCDSSGLSYSNFPHSYCAQGRTVLLMGDHNFNVLDYEVFSLADTTVI